HEQPDHGFRAGQIGGPAGYDGPEHDIRVARVTADHDRPYALEHGVQREAMRAAEISQPRSELARQLQGAPGYPSPVRQRVARVTVDGETVGRAETGQHLAPERFGPYLVLLPDPVDVVHERSGRRQVRRAPCAGEAVKLPELTEQNGDRPTFENDVMK